MRELDFFCGYHGSGKTFTANALLGDFNAEIIDCGPIIRKSFQDSHILSFDEWIKRQESELGDNWDDLLILRETKSIKRSFDSQSYLFIVGNRSLGTINFLKRELSDGKTDKILFFEKPFSVMKYGYEQRTGKHLTDEEFMQIIRSDEKMGLLEIKRYVESNPEANSIIKSDRYDIDSIELSRKIISRSKI